MTSRGLVIKDNRSDELILIFHHYLELILGARQANLIPARVGIIYNQ